MLGLEGSHDLVRLLSFCHTKCCAALPTNRHGVAQSYHASCRSIARNLRTCFCLGFRHPKKPRSNESSAPFNPHQILIGIRLHINAHVNTYLHRCLYTYTYTYMYSNAHGTRSMLKYLHTETPGASQLCNPPPSIGFALVLSPTYMATLGIYGGYEEIMTGGPKEGFGVAVSFRRSQH